MKRPKHTTFVLGVGAEPEHITSPHDDGYEDEGVSEEEEHCAKEILEAIERRDHKLLAEALKNFFEDEEAEEDNEDEEGGLPMKEEH